MKVSVKLVLFLICIGFLIFNSCKKETFNETDEQGRKQGPWKFYFESGELEKVVNYKDDYKFGTETRYYPSGEKNLEMTWQGDTLGVFLDGDYKHYYDNGQVLHEMSYNEGVPTGIVTYYYRNGKKEIEGQYNSGMKSGVWKYYREDGSLEKSIDYKAYEQDWNEDFRAGRYTFYGPDGTPYYKATFEAGNLVEDEVLDLVLFQKYKGVLN